MKRWKNFIAEFGAELKYKPGKENIIADALSRQGGDQINLTTKQDENKRGDSQINLNTITTERIKVPLILNPFKLQIEIEKSDHNSITTNTIFPKYINYKIKFVNLANLIAYIKLIASNKKINAIYSTEETLQIIEKPIQDAFINRKFIFTTKKISNITNVDEQNEIVATIHNRAHRNSTNNYKEAIKHFFWPKMKKSFPEICPEL